ncbi:MAG: ABC transporter permease subunit [Candidatus Hodarchaeales archaeon]|jgi:ABC-2 type transport system permease protein
MEVKQIQKYESDSKYNVSLFNLTIYFKFLRKGWLLVLLPGLVIAVFGLMMASIWPEFESVINDPSFTELLNSPFYQALAGTGTLNLSTFEGFWAIEILTILDFLMLFIVIFFPSRIITNEVDKNTLDIALSYPVPRWQFVLQKFLVYLTQMAVFSALIFISAFLSEVIVGEPFNYENLFLACVAIFLLFFALGSLSLLAGALFLESGKALPVAAVFIIGSWIFDTIGTLSESYEILRNFSVHYYLVPTDILGSGEFPLDGFFIVLAIGVIAFIGSLIVFQKKELSY